MSAIYTWYRPWQALSANSDTTGFQLEYDYLIFPPESLQRVVFRCEMSGVSLNFNTSPEQVPSGGLFICRLTLQNDVEDKSLALVTRGVVHSYYNSGQPAIGQPFIWINATHSPVELDLEVRESAPPPPAQPLRLGVQITYEPFRTSLETYFAQDDIWRGNFDLQYLTSQPGVTTPP